MNKCRMVLVVSGLLVFSGLSSDWVHAAVVTATGGGATLAILDTSNNDLPDGAFPEPQQILKLVLLVNGTPTTINEITFDSTTTAYPGICTNWGSASGADFEVVPGIPEEIRSLDCGGTAVVVVNGTYQFKFPADFDEDGIPDWFEQKSCQSATCLDPMADTELQGSNQNPGDGFPNIDEYRGFIVNDQHIRTSPVQKDLFVHLENPEKSQYCNRVYDSTPPLTSSEDSLLGLKLGEAQPSGRVVYPTDNTPLFEALNLGGTSSRVAVHFIDYKPGTLNLGTATAGVSADGENIGTDEWVDNLDYFNPDTSDETQRIIYTADPASDRRVNINSQSAVQKGIRLIECLDDEAYSPIGEVIFPSGVIVGTPNSIANAIVYTQRIHHDFTNLLNKTSDLKPSNYKQCAMDATCLYYQTYTETIVHHVLTPTATGPTNRAPKPTAQAGTLCTVDIPLPDLNCNNVDINYITSKYIEYVAAMELGHTVALVPEIQRTGLGPHYASGTGDDLDERIVAKDSKQLKGILFSIPSAYGSKSNKCFQITGNTPDPNCE
jgi:hypothetical protein